MNAKTHRIMLICISLLLVAALATTLGIFEYREKQYKRELGAIYDAAYYAAIDNLGDMSNKLMKLDAATSDVMRKELLNGVYTDAEVLTAHLAMLSGKNNEIEKTMKFSNQLGDYTYYLAAKLPDEDISSEEKDKLVRLREIVVKLEEAFLSAGENVAEGGNLYSALGAEVNTLDGVYDLFNAGNVEYPEMIYDGPFSDGLNDREAKFLKDKEEISREEADLKVAELFGSGYEYQGENEASIATYTYRSESGAGVQITQKGGVVAEYASAREGGEATLSEEDAIARAAELLPAYGYYGMSAVWVSVNNGTAYINFAYAENDVIYYPDLVKVKISLDTGEITGLSGMNYIYNHTAREPIGETGNVEEVVLNEGFVTTSTRLTVIPTEWNTEIAAFEFAGKIGDNIYYLYFDAKTLEEVKVMRVVKDGNEGNLIV